MAKELKPYTEYQNTEYDWLPQVPKHWEKRSIRTLTKLSDKRCGSRDDLELLSVYREYGVIRKASRDDNHNVESLDLSNYKYVGNDYLVMNKMKMWQGSLGVSSYKGIVSPAYIVCSFTIDANYRYFHYLLRSATFKTQYNRISYGIRVGQWDMRYNDFKNINLYIPTRTEQDQIVKFLDYKISKINKFIKSKKREIELLKELKQAEINRAVTKGLNPSVPMKDCGIDWLGEIPEHWEIRRLKNAMNFNPSLEVDINLQDDTDVSFMPMECLRTDYIEKRESNYKDVKGYVPFQNGDVVMAKVTPCFENRNIAVANELTNGVGFGTSEIFVFRCTEILTNKFLMYFLQTEYFRNNAIASMTGTGGLKRVSPKVARNIQLPIPDKSEQIEIVELLGKKCNSIEKMISSIMNEINTIQEYKTSLISDVVIGKVDVRDVSIEDAFEMETLDEVEAETEELVEE